MDLSVGETEDSGKEKIIGYQYKNKFIEIKIKCGDGSVDILPAWNA